MRKVFVAILVIAALALAGAAYLFSTLDDQTEASVPDVVAEFRDTKGEERREPGHPRQGVYRYTVEGDERIRRGPVDVTRTLPTEAVALVRHTPTGFAVDTRYSDEHIELSHYEVRPDGVHVTRAVTTLRVGPIETVKDREWKPELLRFPDERRDLGR